MAFDPNGASVLITGGSSGIGLGLATRFMAAGAKVMITGRDAARLELVQRDHPGMLARRSDLGDEQARVDLAAHVAEVLPDLDIVINNGGIQRRVGLAADVAPWSERQEEIDILLAAPVHLNHLLIPALLKSGRPSMIANVSSGGAFIPQVFAPVYSACKAAIHSYTMTLREALKDTSCRVVEIIPPAVRTNLGGAAPHGAPLDAFCDAIFEGFTAGEDQIGFGPTRSPEFLDAAKPYAAMFRQSADRANVRGYG